MLPYILEISRKCKVYWKTYFKVIKIYSNQLIAYIRLDLIIVDVMIHFQVNHSMFFFTINAYYYRVNKKKKEYSGKILMKFLIHAILTDNLPKSTITCSCECDYYEYNHNTKYYMNTLKLVKLFGKLRCH